MDEAHIVTEGIQIRLIAGILRHQSQQRLIHRRLLPRLGKQGGNHSVLRGAQQHRLPRFRLGYLCFHLRQLPRQLMRFAAETIQLLRALVIQRQQLLRHRLPLPLCLLQLHIQRQTLLHPFLIRLARHIILLHQPLVAHLILRRQSLPAGEQLLLPCQHLRLRGQRLAPPRHLRCILLLRAGIAAEILL